MLSKDLYKKMAKDTIQILDKRYYKNFDITNDVDFSINSSFLFSPNDDIKILDNNIIKTGNILFTNNTTSQEIFLQNSLENINNINSHICALNFSSAKHPGGGFLNGANAQEESLCRISSLYKSISQFKKMYEYNKYLDGFYSDYIIFSNRVVFIKNDQGRLVEPYYSSIITSPAVNNSNIKEELKYKIKDVMINRIKRILTIAINANVDTIILGAYGCGIFKNDPCDVASYFKNILIDNNMKKYFNNIIFAIPDKNTSNIFQEVFK